MMALSTHGRTPKSRRPGPDVSTRANEVLRWSGRSVTQAGNRKVGDDTVSATDKAKNKAEDLGGKAREPVGKVTGDERTPNEGRGDQAKSNLKDAGEKVKDAFKK
jgi:uncharacterized protein YjbJ (UPF0337 family)